MDKNDNELLDIDFSRLDNLELSELLATLEGMNEVLKEQENLIKEGDYSEK